MFSSAPLFGPVHPAQLRLCALPLTLPAPTLWQKFGRLSSHHYSGSGLNVFIPMPQIAKRFYKYSFTQIRTGVPSPLLKTFDTAPSATH